MKSTGRCLCGAVAWEAEGPLELMHFCHCTRCRKAHGAAFATDVLAPSAGFRWSRGEEAVARFGTAGGLERTFCGRCGASLPARADAERSVLPAGALDGDPGVRPLAHLFVAAKAPWWTIADDLPRFDAWPPGMGGPVLETPGAGPAEGEGLRGSCLCGAVRYRLEGPLRAVRNCHCSRCRRARGTAFATNGFAPAGALRFEAGEERIRSFAVPEARFFRHAFCETCGSSLPRADEARGVALVPMGTLDEDPGARPECHIHVASKAPWYAIADDLPQHAEGAPA